jgi:hypothetical protein
MKPLRVLWALVWYPFAFVFALLCLCVPIPGWIILAIWHNSDKRKEQHRELMKALKPNGA